jgi:anion-transporting  ArsA/GET3 family ATPase
LKNDPASPQPPSNPSRLSDLLSKEFIFVTGKGGVGKSTCAALLGLACGQLGRRALVVFPESEAHRRSVFGRQLSEVPVKVAEGVDAVTIHPETAMRQYLAGVLGGTRLASFLFHSQVARGLLMGIPGPSDWAILGKAWSWSASGTFDLPNNQRHYDLVILDAPASGDGSDMLRIPQVILELAPAARLRDDAKSCLLSLRNPKKSAVVLVTLPEEVVVQETEENIEVVRHDLGLPLGPLLINQVHKALFNPADRALLNGAPDPKRSSRSGQKVASSEPLSAEERSLRCFEVARDRAQRETLQIEHLTRIEQMGLPTLKIPYVEGNLTGISALQKLQKALAEGH